MRTRTSWWHSHSIPFRAGYWLFCKRSLAASAILRRRTLELPDMGAGISLTPWKNRIKTIRAWIAANCNSGSDRTKTKTTQRSREATKSMLPGACPHPGQQPSLRGRFPGSIPQNSCARSAIGGKRHRPRSEGNLCRLLKIQKHLYREYGVFFAADPLNEVPQR